MSERYVLCEGYHDRAFWGGLLLHLGATDPGVRPGGLRAPIIDPWGLSVRGGEFAYRSLTQQFLRIVPASGKQNVLALLENRLKQRASKSVLHLVVNVDSDLHADGTTAVAPAVSAARVETILRKFDPALTTPTAGEFVLDAGATRVSIVRWHTAEPPAEGLPNQQSLERVICSAIRASYAARAPAVQSWLDSRPDAPVAGAKSYAWSYLAGWYAEERTSYEAFCSGLWDDPALAAALKSLLIDCGAWAVALDLTK